LGAFALGVFANAFGRIANQPSTIVAMHGLIVLVPGSKTYIGLKFVYFRSGLCASVACWARSFFDIYVFGCGVDIC